MVSTQKSFQYSPTETGIESANEILPRVFEDLKFRSILDVGCGLAHWLTAAQSLGVSDIFGVDAARPESNDFQISDDRFAVWDSTKVLNLKRKFDLCLCLEVAEHLPEDQAPLLIKSLTRHADWILFSAAVPGQPGQGHINTQWPAYWNEQFKKEGYELYDLYRPTIWTNESIKWWYRQNLLVATRPESLRSSVFASVEAPEPLALVHPELYLRIRYFDQLGVKADES